MGEPWPPGGARTLARPDDLSMPDPGPAAALRLFAQVLGARTLAAAAHALVATLAADFQLSRASLGLREQGRTRLQASSALDSAAQASGELADHLTGAMDEAMDQGLALAWPAAPQDADDDLLRLELRLLQAPLGGSVAVLPLGRDGQPLGAVCLERAAGPAFSTEELARLGQLLQLAAPALGWLQQAEAGWWRRARQQLRQALDRLRQPDRRLARRLSAAGLAALAALAGLPLAHEVGGRARIEGAEQRVLAAPTDGFVKAAHVRPGDQVLAGAPLLDLMEDDLRLERERWASQLAQHENAYAAAMARSDRVGAATSGARVDEAASQLALVDERLSRGRIVAPFDAVVIAGDLSQSIGAPVRQGDSLLTLATSGRHRVIVEVDEVDIARVMPGQPGRLALSALPWQGEDLVVERIAPLARAVDGRNVFEVEARLLSPRADLRPGLLGRAELEVGRRPPLWVWLGHALDRLRVSWWAWLG